MQYTNLGFRESGQRRAEAAWQMLSLQDPRCASMAATTASREDLSLPLAGAGQR